MAYNESMQSPNQNLGGSGRRKTPFLWIAVLSTLALLALLGGLRLYAEMQFNPAPFRQVGLMPPVSTQAEPVVQMEGVLYRNFETAVFVACADYQGQIFGKGSTPLNWTAKSGFEQRFDQLAEAQGSTVTEGLLAFARFKGQRIQLRNATILEGFGPNGLSRQKIDIQEVLALEVYQDQCGK